MLAAMDAGLIPEDENGDYDDEAFERFWASYNARKPLKEEWGLSKEEYRRARKIDNIYMAGAIFGTILAAIALAINFIAMVKMERRDSAAARAPTRSAPRLR